MKTCEVLDLTKMARLFIL